MHTPFVNGCHFSGVSFFGALFFLCLTIKHRDYKGYKGYKDGPQPESLADGSWLVKQNQPVLKIETKSDTNLSSLYES